MNPEACAPSTRHITLPSGLRIHVASWAGPPTSDVPVLLIHGLGDSTSVWRDVALKLARHRSVLAVDLRGHGASDWHEGGEYGADAMAGDVRALLDTLALGRVAVVGHSLGGSVALHLANAHPSCVERIALADFSPEMSAEVAQHVVRELRSAHRLYESIDEYARTLADRHPLAAPALLQRVARETTYAQPEEMATRYALKYDPDVLSSIERVAQAAGGLLQRPRAWEFLGALRCPLLVLRGSGSSVLTGPTAQRMVQRAPDGARLCIVPISGHSVHIDNPDAVADALRAFIEERPGVDETAEQSVHLQ